MSPPELPVFLRSGSSLQRLMTGGGISMAEIVHELGGRLEQREPLVKAWATHDLGRARAQADTVTGQKPLAGFTIGVKDIIDTRHFPTTYGSPLYKGHMPDRDAECVRLLEHAGALVLGKTVTTEFAAYAPAKTCNPHHPEHTPGGSSSGSAAAVADGHVAVALGTQTAGSIIRPASFCGVIGFKPSYGRYSLAGVMPLALSLDTLGLLARSFDDLLAVDNVLARDPIKDGGDPSGEPIVAFLHSAWDGRVDPEMKQALYDARERFAQAGLTIRDMEAPDWFPDIEAAQSYVMAHEASHYRGGEEARSGDKISSQFRNLLETGRSLTSDDLQWARRTIRALRRWRAHEAADIDILVTPSALGPAPRGLDHTGDPLFCRPWTATGDPAVNIPIGIAKSGLPLGAQLVGRVGDDRRLIRWASRLSHFAGRPIAYLQD